MRAYYIIKKKVFAYLYLNYNFKNFFSKLKILTIIY